MDPTLHSFFRYKRKFAFTWYTHKMKEKTQI
jgi:hypothetical protein